MGLTPDAQAEHDYLYECLSILDAKASALLSFNSILLAALALTVTIGENRLTSVLLSGLVLSGLSSLLCLRVVWVHWTPTETFSDSRHLFITLLEVRDRRTVVYRIAWLAALASLLCLVVGVAVGA